MIHRFRDGVMPSRWALLFLFGLAYGSAARGQTPTPTPACIAYYNGQTQGVASQRVGRATTQNVNCNGGWSRRPLGAPVIPNGGPGDWDAIQSHGPLCLRLPEAMYCYYYGASAAGVEQIGLAISADGITFTKASSNPIVQAVSGTWEARLHSPIVVYDVTDAARRRFKMWYKGFSADGAADIGHAWSVDGVSWTKSPRNPVFHRSASGWDSFRLTPGFVKKDEGTGVWYLFFAGRTSSANDWQVGVATFSDPEGTYTRYPGNPIIPRRAISQDLTADMTAGSSVVHVASTAAFQVNELVLVGDKASGTLLSQVQSVDNDTQMTLTDATSATFATTHRAAVRDSYASVNVNFVWVDTAGTPRMLLTGFTAFTDYGYQREYAGFAIANTPTPGATPTGTPRAPWATTSWSYDFASGILLKPDTPNSMWDVTSSENPQLAFTQLPTRTPTASVRRRGRQRKHAAL